MNKISSEQNKYNKQQLNDINDMIEFYKDRKDHIIFNKRQIKKLEKDKNMFEKLIYNFKNQSTSF